jgi:mono/diheme cytochrome c family protein
MSRKLTKFKSCGRCLFGAIAFISFTAFLTTANAAEPTNRSGEEIYNKVCALCHDTRVGPKLLGRQLSADAVKSIVRLGLNGMPAFRQSEISPTELEAVAQFVMTSPSQKDTSK